MTVLTAAQKTAMALESSSGPIDHLNFRPRPGVIVADATTTPNSEDDFISSEGHFFVQVEIKPNAATTGTLTLYTWSDAQSVAMIYAVQAFDTAACAVITVETHGRPFWIKTAAAVVISYVLC